MEKIVLSKIINEEINRVLKENFGMEKLYHFTSLEKLWNILSSNTFKCTIASTTDVKPEFIKSPKYDIKRYPYYVSLTRMRDNLSGYPSWGGDDFNVRIVFNGSLLQTIQNSRLIPFNDFPLAKQNMNTIGNVPFDTFGKKARENSSAIECEERFLTTKPTIPNVMNYVTRIDIGFNNFNKMLDWYTRNFYYALNDDFKKKIFIYYKANDFRYQTNNNVDNLYTLSNHGEEEPL